ncbi:hypothetical protein BVRB_032480 [Beta vulgaris subsp. vulgaris]|uniref:Uncharacterized protein n=1 Tax=Beta vulgaris subsp. vulgaris TaxID=3555 RepID=A0A0J8AWV9_BETVV|nr:hypothetical protein BVRB_032480 [Beta vulgaris subsp. vulgaris]
MFQAQGQVQTGPFGSLPWAAARYARKAVRLAPWALPGFLLGVWMVEPAVSQETRYRLWTLGLYGGPKTEE